MIPRLILLALVHEAPTLAQRSDVFVTGLGKVNAAIATTNLIHQYRPREIINFGTAGGITVSQGLHRCTKFIQRDMNCQALGFAAGQIPFDDHSMICISDAGLVCGTGDDFVNGVPLLVPADVVDMEAYAMARACQQHGVVFSCWKYVSDQADEQAATQWKDSVSKGEQCYIDKLAELDI